MKQNWFNLSLWSHIIASSYQQQQQLLPQWQPPRNSYASISNKHTPPTSYTTFASTTNVIKTRYLHRKSPPKHVTGALWSSLMDKSALSSRTADNIPENSSMLSRNKLSRLLTPLSSSHSSSLSTSLSSPSSASPSSSSSSSSSSSQSSSSSSPPSISTDQVISLYMQQMLGTNSPLPSVDPTSGAKIFVIKSNCTEPYTQEHIMQEHSESTRNALIYIAVILAIYLVAVASIAIQYYHKHSTLDPLTSFVLRRSTTRRTPRQDRSRQSNCVASSANNRNHRHARNRRRHSNSGASTSASTSTAPGGVGGTFSILGLMSNAHKSRPMIDKASDLSEMCSGSSTSGLIGNDNGGGNSSGNNNCHSENTSGRGGGGGGVRFDQQSQTMICHETCATNAKIEERQQRKMRDNNDVNKNQVNIQINIEMVGDDDDLEEDDDNVEEDYYDDDDDDDVDEEDDEEEDDEEEDDDDEEEEEENNNNSRRREQKDKKDRFIEKQEMVSFSANRNNVEQINQSHNVQQQQQQQSKKQQTSLSPKKRLKQFFSHFYSHSIDSRSVASAPSVAAAAAAPTAVNCTNNNNNKNNNNNYGDNQEQTRITTTASSSSATTRATTNCRKTIAGSNSLQVVADIVTTTSVGDGADGALRSPENNTEHAMTPSAASSSVCWRSATNDSDCGKSYKYAKSSSSSIASFTIGGARPLGQLFKATQPRQYEETHL